MASGKIDGSSGRRKSFARKYFLDVENTNDSKCIVDLGSGKLCNQIIGNGGRWGGNLKRHLRFCHKEILKLVEDEEKQAALPLKPESEKRKVQCGRNELIQKKLSAWIKPKDKYKTSSVEYNRITEAVTLFFGGTNCPKSIIEHPLFINLVASLNSQYEVPSRWKITDRLTKLRLKLDQQLKATLLAAKRVTVVLDLWSKKDMTPFIGVTAHFYDRHAKCRRHVTLGLKVLPNPHTSSIIYNKLNDILQYWNLDEGKIFKILTDNASNMIKAFSSTDHQTVVEAEENENVGENEIETTDSIGSDTISDEENEFEDYLEADPNLDVTFDEGDVDIDEADLDLFQMQQQEFWNRKHLQCLVHSLQLVVRRFLKENSLSVLVSKSIALVRRFSKSTTATGKLKKLTKLHLRRYCQTRWSSFYNMIERLIKIQDYVKMVCQQVDFDVLLASQWLQLGRLKEILQPFAEFTLELEAHKSTTLSLVVPSVKDLIIHVEKMKANGHFRLALMTMQNDLKSRFGYIINSDSNLFNPTYMVATALDPRYRCILTNEEITVAKLYLLEQLNSQIGQFGIGINAAERVMDDGATTTGEPKMKRFRYVTINRHQVSNENRSQTPIHDEVEKYFNDPTEVSEDSDPIEYWNTAQTMYPVIADLAIDFLVTPCSSASVESMFSHAGALCSGARSQISADNLESQVIIKTNFFGLQ